MKVTVGLVAAAIAITTVHAGIPQMMKSPPSELSSTSSSADGSSAVDSFCPDYCLDVMRPVYDEAGKMYSNECYMQRAKCKHKKKDVNILEEYKRLYGKSFGASRDDAGDDSASYEDDSSSEESGSSSATPTFVKGTKSASDEGSTTSSSSADESSSTGTVGSFCPDACLAVYNPVTDENGVTYSNECEMLAAKCTHKRKNVNVLEEFKRIYGHSFGASREIDIDDESAGGSSSAATKMVKSTKGSDKAAKKSPNGSSSIGDLYDEGSDGVIGSRIDEPPQSKKCASGCPDVELPVCGSDGVKYSNPCELKIAACQNPELHIVEADAGVCSKATKQDETVAKKSSKLHVILP